MAVQWPMERDSVSVKSDDMPCREFYDLIKCGGCLLRKVTKKYSWVTKDKNEYVRCKYIGNVFYNWITLEKNVLFIVSRQSSFVRFIKSRNCYTCFS